ncbi:MAG TPA: MotA/TolQ/ExbB proton channel family protein [Myxococcota bacterium]|nr:MotA/TolQ/ExbB proton channel family protein [Myxococcota bacterium]
MKRRATIVVLAAGLVLSGLAASADEMAGAAAIVRTPLEWYVMGGPAMHALALCSVLVLGGVLERSFALRASATVPPALGARVAEALEVGNRGELKRLLAGGRSALTRLGEAALDPALDPAALETRGAWEAHRLRRNLSLIAALGSLATMIGLLGTVLGMIEAFDRIALEGTGDARIVAGGIFRALVTTAAGLGIGVVALGAHALLSRRAEDRVAALEHLTGCVVEGRAVRCAAGAPSWAVGEPGEESLTPSGDSAPFAGRRS